MKKKYIIVALFIFTLAGCTSTQPINNSSTQQPANTTEIQATAEPSPTISENWKQYTNDQFGVSFRYPPEYTDPKITNNELISFMSPIDTTKVKNQNVNEKELKVELYIQPRKTADTLDSFITEHGHTHQEENNILEEKDVTIDGKEAHYHKVQGLGVVDNFFVITDSYKILIIKYPNETERQSEFDQILQSMRFTK